MVLAPAASPARELVRDADSRAPPTTTESESEV